MRHKGQTHWAISKYPTLDSEISLSDFLIYFLPLYTRSHLIIHYCHFICALFANL